MRLYALETDMTKVPNRTTLSIPVDVTRAARARAIKEGTSLSALITLFLKAWLAGEIETPQPQPEKEVKPKRKK